MSVISVTFSIDLLTRNMSANYQAAKHFIGQQREFSSDGTLYASFANLYTLNARDMSTIATVGNTGGVYIENLTFGNGEILYEALTCRPRPTRKRRASHLRVITPSPRFSSSRRDLGVRLRDRSRWYCPAVHKGLYTCVICLGISSVISINFLFYVYFWYTLHK